MSLSISGTSSYRLQGGVATVELDRVTYTGTGVSGTVRLELWATTTPYGGGGHQRLSHRRLCAHRQ